MKFAVLFVALLAACAQAQCPKYVFLTFLATSKNANGLKKIESNFRRALGGIDNGNNIGPIANGHRSINWDAAIVPFDMPGNFFDKTVTRGALFKARGKKFAVSNPAAPPPVDNRFSSLLPIAQTSRFKTFSPLRLFTPVKSNKLTTLFRVPGKKTKAAVTGYGSIFTDVDRAKKTTMKFFDKKNCLIAKLNVPPRSKGLSFAGIVVLTPGNPNKPLRSIYKVATKLGTIPVERFNNVYSGKFSGDVVVLDDLIYGEPL